MKKFGRLLILALMTVGLTLPGLAGTAAAQDPGDLCNQANGLDAGTPIGGYTVAYGSGGSGSQIVLGYGGEYLSGGSGNDILCAWGTGNTLDGGSGNDLLIAMDLPGNIFDGGSGNDTMTGYIGDVFDGGSGRNSIVENEPIVLLTLDLWPVKNDDGDFFFRGSGFTPDYSVEFQYYYPDDTFPSTITSHTDLQGNFSTGLDTVSQVGIVLDYSCPATESSLNLTLYAHDDFTGQSIEETFTGEELCSL